MNCRRELSRACHKEISESLTYIINLSLKSESVPSKWKYTRFTPIHKTGDTTKPENCRPTWISPIFSKILERAMHPQLSKYFENGKLLTNYQFRYRTNRSTKLASTLLNDNIRKSINKEDMVGDAFINFTKTFDIFVGFGT